MVPVISGTAYRRLHGMRSPYGQLLLSQRRHTLCTCKVQHVNINHCDARCVSHVCSAPKLVLAGALARTLLMVPTMLCRPPNRAINVIFIDFVLELYQYFLLARQKCCMTHAVIATAIIVSLTMFYVGLAVKTASYTGVCVQVNGRSGRLTTRRLLDTTAVGTQSLTVTATDSGQPALTASCE